MNNNAVYCPSCGNSIHTLDVALRSDFCLCPSCSSEFVPTVSCSECNVPLKINTLTRCDGCGIILCHFCSIQKIKQHDKLHVCGICEKLYDKEFDMNLCDVVYSGKKTAFQLSFDELYCLWLISPESVNLNTEPVNVQLQSNLIDVLEKLQTFSQSDLKNRLLTAFNH